MTWTRARRVRICGVCGRTVRVGAPLAVFTLSGAVEKVRCAACAGEPVPADLPVLDARVNTITPQPKMRRLGSVVLPFDYKTAQFREREPGEEG